jgi:hypothetical protein
MSSDRIENVHGPVSVLVLGARHQPHIVFCSERQVIVWFADVATSNAESLTTIAG